MGESKLPIFTYVDESGNTGKNIFDANQPEFFTAALVNKGDFDAQWGGRIKAVAQRVGADAIHANELGIGRLEEVADELFAILSASGAHFFVSRVEKRYLLATKMFDVLFDSGENAAVAWHNYNLKPLKIVLAFKLSAVLDEEIAREFWDILMLARQGEARKRLPGFCERLKGKLHILPDARSREILGEGLDWIVDHPECVQVVEMEQKIAKQGHYPNLVGFINLLDGLERYSKLWKKKIARITHDETNEFGRVLKQWHELHSNASPEIFRWAGEEYSVQFAAGSKFVMAKDHDSPGIQMADTALWLYGQYLKGKRLPPGCAGILNLVLERGWQNDFSFQGVHDSIVEQWGEVFYGPIAPEKLEASRAMLDKAEAARRESMAQYEADGLAPFERSLRPTAIEG